jgi:hypothetical protein
MSKKLSQALKVPGVSTIVLNNSIYMPKLQQLRLETEGLVGEGQPPLTPTEPTVKDSMKVLVSGGGALNKFLFTRL